MYQHVRCVQGESPAGSRERTLGIPRRDTIPRASRPLHGSETASLTRIRIARRTVTWSLSNSPGRSTDNFHAHL